MGNALSNTIFGQTSKLRKSTTAGMLIGLGNLFKRLTGAGITDAQSEQNEFNAIQAQINRDYQTQMSNTANQRAVKDMQAAGLNPALMYGSGSAATTPSGSTASTGSAPSYESFASLVQMMQLPKQLELIESQIKANYAAAGKVAEETESERVRRQQMLTEISHIQSDIDLKLTQTNLTEAQRANLELATSWLDRLNEATLKSVEAKSALDVSTKNRLDALVDGEINLQNATLANFAHQWQKISAEVDKIADERNLLKEDLENYLLNHMSNGFMGSGISLQNLIREAVGHRAEVTKGLDKELERLERSKAERDSVRNSRIKHLRDIKVPSKSDLYNSINRKF